MGFLVGEQVVLTNTFSVGGVPTDPTTTSLAVTSPAGVTTTYTYGPGDLVKTGPGVYTITIPATAPGTWVYVWTGTGTAPDIAPGFFTAATVTPSYVTLAELRALPNLADTAKFTNAELAAACDWFETLFEDYTGVAWVPRTATDERHYGTGGTIILDHIRPRTISAVRSYTDATTTVAYTPAELADLHLEPSGMIRRNTLGWFSTAYGLVAVDYTHGFDAPPRDVVEAAKVAIRDHLIVDYQANRQYAVSTEAGIVRTSTPDADAGRPFGIPEVDVVANRRSDRSPSLA